jgi:Fe2+ or Zn2+ uptake regulation protein
MKSDDMIAKIRALGGRQTRVRQALVERLVHEGELASAADLFAYLSKKGIPADRTTVYRELAFLKRNGLIREVTFRGRPSLFEVENEHHHHLVCSECGIYKPIKVNLEVCRAEKVVGRKEKFKISGHSLEFYGLCPKCK